MRAMAAEGFAGANVTVPHKDAALALADEASEAAREIGAANTLAFADGRDPRRQHRRRRPAGRAAAARRGARGRWCSAPAARPGRWSGRWCARGPRSRSGTGPAPRAPSGSAPSSAGAPVAEPDQAAYELIVNTTAVGLRGEDPFAAAAAARRRLRRRPDRRRHGLRRASRARCCGAAEAAGATDGRRDRDPRPAGRPLARASGPAASRRSRRCAPPPAAERLLTP